MGISEKNLVTEEAKVIGPMFNEAQEFEKGLKKFNATLGAFEKVSGKLIQVSQNLVASSGKQVNAMEHTRSQFEDKMASSVHQPIAQWLKEFKDATKSFKEVQKLSATYLKSGKTLDKATAKATRSAREGVVDDKHKKLADKAADAAGKHEATKTALNLHGPRIKKQFEDLLLKKAQLRESIFTAFTVSADALNGLASLSPRPSEPGAKPVAAAPHAKPAAAVGAKAQ